MMKQWLSGMLLMGLAMGVAAPLEGNPEEFAPKEKVTAKAFAGIFPAGIKTIAVVTPASCPSKAAVLKTVELLTANGLTVKMGEHALDDAEEGTKQPPLAGRVADFYAAWEDPAVDLIICTRGGEGTQALIEALDWKRLCAAKPGKMVMGYSDVTLLLCAMLKHGIGHPLTAPMMSSLPGQTKDSLESLADALHGRPSSPVAVTPVRGGDCRGKAVGGHFERLSRLTKMAFRPPLKGRVLFIECVRRTTTQMRGYFKLMLENGYFNEVAAVVFCRFTRMDEPQEAVDTMIDEFARQLTVPVYKGFPYGHVNHLHTIDFQQTAVIENNMLRFIP